MSYSSYNQKLYPQDDIQFKILSQSHQQQIAKPAQNTLLQSIQASNHGQLNQVVMNDDSGDIFNDAIEGGGVEPSINESIRQSIQCSFVSSECGESKLKYQQETTSQIDAQRSNYVMNRMNWITYLKVLFDQLEQFNQNKLKHVETTNFLKGLKKIKNLLPLQTRNDYYKHCSEVAFTYKEVENGVSKMPKYITWDNVIDIFLSKQSSHSVTQNPAKAVVSAFKQLESTDELFQQHPQQIDESQFSEGVDYELAEVEQAYNNNSSKNLNKQSNCFQTNQSAQKRQGSLQAHVMKTKKTEDLFPSFALDSFVNHGNLILNGDYNNSQQLHNSLQQQHILAQAPLLMENPIIGLKDKDDDEACEIDSDYTNSVEGEEDGEESKNQSQNSRARRQRLEESIRSSRTATFKSVRRMSTAQQTAAFQSSATTPPNAINNINLQGSQQQLTSALSAAINVQDSYYAAIKNSTMPQNYQQPSTTQKFIYYQQQQQQKQQQQDSQSRRTSLSKQESRNNSIQFLDNEDGQVELASNNSFGSSSRWRSPGNHGEVNQSIKVEMFDQINKNNLNNINIIEKGSTRISSLNSISKAQNQNNTILSHNSSQSSQSQQKMQNNSKVSIMSSSQHSNQANSSNFYDLEEQGKQLKTYEINMMRSCENKKQLRSVNFSINQLTKVPSGLEKSIQYMNLSYNKLKSLNGIEVCINLKFLNVARNQLSSASNLVLLQSMRELIFAHNQLSILREIGQLKNLQLLDLSYNKIIEFEKLIPLSNLKKMSVLSLQGNLVQKINNYDQQVNKLLSSVKVLDPDEIKDFTQFSQMEHICFTEAPANLSQLNNNNNNNNSSMMIVIDQQLINGYNSQNNHNRDFLSAEKVNEKQSQLYKPSGQQQQQNIEVRSRTPNRDRQPSKLGQQQQQQNQDSKNKKPIHILSPQKNEIELKNAAAGVAIRQNSNSTKNSTNNFSTGKNSISNPNNNNNININSSLYNDNQFRLQNKLQSTGGSVNSVQIQSQKTIKSGNGNGGATQRSSRGPGLLTRDRSYTNEDSKSQTRERSSSDLKNTKLRNNLPSVGGVQTTGIQSQQASGRSTANQLNSFNSTLQSQNTFQSVKDPQVKKISLNTNLAQKNSSQGKITPRMRSANNHNASQNSYVNNSNNLNKIIKINTPKNEKLTNYYKKSFCTEEEPSVYQQLQNDLQNTPSEKNTVRTVQTQDSSSQKLKQITKNNEIYIQPTNVSSPTTKLVKANNSTQSRNTNIRPVTTLKQRVVTAYKNDLSLNEGGKMNNTSIQNSSSSHHNGGLVNSQLQQMFSGSKHLIQPQSTKNATQNFSHSFVIDNQLTSSGVAAVAGRQTPTNANSNISVSNVFGNTNRPSSQLQKFINASSRPLAAQQSSRPSQTQMSFHSALPSQKLTNLPPKAYQTKTGNPGDKKSKADMSLSMISSHNIIQNQSQINNNTNNNISLNTNPLNTNSSGCVGKNQNSILQTGGSFPEDSHVDTISSRSMSPVLEESNNIKKLKVDLTQYMNKQ